MARLLAIPWLSLLLACPQSKPARGRTDCSPIDPSLLPAEEGILFGDLHVHSTYSLDARVTNLPLVGGHGPAGPRHRCDFARFCSQLDFWAITDHPEEQTPELWADTVEAVRECNDLEGGYSASPRMVTFLGWEWTQRGPSPEEDWGHRNVVLPDTCDDAIAPRPVAAPTGFGGVNVGAIRLLADVAINIDPDNEQLYDDFLEYVVAASEVPTCNSAALAALERCRETAATPRELFDRLGRLGVGAQVIPHGRTWASNHPAGVSA